MQLLVLALVEKEEQIINLTMVKPLVVAECLMVTLERLE
jgi:hypothetical protein